MGDSNELIYQALSKYFTLLETSGYLKNSEVNKVLLLIFLKDLLLEFKDCMEDEDIRFVDDIISCLTTSSCIIPTDGHRFAQFVKNCCGN